MGSCRSMEFVLLHNKKRKVQGNGEEGGGWMVLFFEPKKDMSDA